MIDGDMSHWATQDCGAPREVTVGELLREASDQAPARVALVEAAPAGSPSRTWTYRDLLTQAEQAARALAARFEPGDRVAIWAPNTGTWMVLQQALSLAGLVSVPLNPAYRERELVYALTQSGARGLFHADNHRGFDMAGLVPRVSAQCPDVAEVVSLEDWDNFVASGDPVRDLPRVRPQDPLAILYTSGTTGQPKGALLHHMGVVNQAHLVAQRAGLATGGVWINAMPLYHMAGGGVTALGVISMQGTQVIMPEFDAGEMLRLFEAHRGTHALLVPTMLISLLEHPDLRRRDLTSVETILSGAATVPAELVKRTTSTLNCRFSILFGQAETHGVISQTTVDDSPEDQSLTIGRPLPWLEVKIADPETGATLPLGAAGEICCRGYQNMLEYFRMPEATAATIDGDGWLHSGDLGAMDERGYLRIAGRLKEMIIRGGLNIYPREIEDVLFGHPQIADVAVIGVPDDRWGEQVAAVVRVHDGFGRPTLDSLKEYCTDRMARHKAPTQWYFVDHFPLTPTGKIQKFALTSMVAAGDLRAHVIEPS